MTPKFMMVNGTKVYDLGNGLEIAHNLTRVFDTQFTLNYDNDQVEKGMELEFFGAMLILKYIFSFTFGEAS